MEGQSTSDSDEARQRNNGCFCVTINSYSNFIDHFFQSTLTIFFLFNLRDFLFIRSIKYLLMVNHEKKSE